MDTKSLTHRPAEPTGDRLVDLLRADILSGRFPPESRVAEEKIAHERGLSRTPIRHALRALEQDGLLTRLPRRGYRVRSYSIEEVADAIEVRGEMEAMAARLHAEAGWIGGVRSELLEVLRLSRALIDCGVTKETRLKWASLNLAWHDRLVHGTAKVGLVSAYEHLKRIPLVSPGAMLFERDCSHRTTQQLIAAQEDHARITSAIDERKGQRAAEIMRDHAIRSGNAKRINSAGLRANTFIASDLGAALITR